MLRQLAIVVGISLTVLAAARAELLPPPPAALDMYRVVFAMGMAGLMAIGVAAFLVSRVRWAAISAGLSATSLGVEAAALALRTQADIVVDTFAWQVALMASALATLVSAIPFRRILLAIADPEGRDTRIVLAQVMSDSFAGVVVMDETGAITAASRSAAGLLGFADPQDLIGRHMSPILPLGLSRAVAQAIRDYKAAAWSEAAPQTMVDRRPDCDERILEYVIRPSRLSGGVTRRWRAAPDRFVASLTFADVTESRRAQERLAYFARFDTLTGLPNRHHAIEWIEARLRGAKDQREWAVLFLDLDRFKTINTSLGHDFGDYLLCAVAERVRRLVEAGDLVARLAGDEFAVILHDPGGRRAATLARTLIRSVGEPYLLNGHRLRIGVSIGCASPDAGTTDAQALLKQADTAMHRAKAGGGNDVRAYAPYMDAGVAKRQDMEVDLWHAFQKNQFEVHYQPQVDLQSGALTGVEALLRWRHPERGYVSPAEFIPVAEATGLMEPLGGWILRESCATVAGWPKPVRLAVNISPLQFVRGDLVAKVTHALASSRLPAAQLDLEITESLFLEPGSTIDDTVARLRAMAVSFVIDDFGTGYSSLGYLRKFPVRKLKIDKTFIDGLPSEPEATAIVRAIVTLARSLRIQVNAEGVEGGDQAKALEALGCHEGQGWLFGKPVPGPQIAAMMREADRQRLSA